MSESEGNRLQWMGFLCMIGTVIPLFKENRSDLKQPESSGNLRACKNESYIIGGRKI